MTTLSIFTGNIGSGKSLLAAKMAKRGRAVIDMDSIVEMVGGGEYGCYDERKRCIYRAAEEGAIEAALGAGIPVVIDRTNMKRSSRQRYIEIGRRHGVEIISYDWGPGSAENLRRRLESDRCTAHGVWRSVYERMHAEYEQPEAGEGFNMLLRGPSSYTIHAFDFDGTLVEHRFPVIGPVIEENVEYLRDVWLDDSNIVIIWTCRSGDYVNRMRQWLLDNNVPFDFINENPLVDLGSPKIFAHYYYDDRSGVLPVRM